MSLLLAISATTPLGAATGTGKRHGGRWRRRFRCRRSGVGEGYLRNDLLNAQHQEVTVFPWLVCHHPGQRAALSLRIVKRQSEDGWAWTPERKEQYANNLEYPGHLIAVTAGANRSKGAKSPDEWRPPNESYWCEYAVAWITVKQTWELTATSPEAEALEEMLGTCASPPRLTVRPADPPPAPAEPTSSPTATDTYADCDEAEEAGEERVPGTNGPGRGFPQSKVPSARDGDGDGIVCEK